MPRTDPYIDYTGTPQRESSKRPVTMDAKVYVYDSAEAAILAMNDNTAMLVSFIAASVIQARAQGQVNPGDMIFTFFAKPIRETLDLAPDQFHAAYEAATSIVVRSDVENMPSLNRFTRFLTTVSEDIEGDSLLVSFTLVVPNFLLDAAMDPKVERVKGGTAL